MPPHTQPHNSQIPCHLSIVFIEMSVVMIKQHRSNIIDQTNAFRLLRRVPEGRDIIKTSTIYITYKRCATTNNKYPALPSTNHSDKKKQIDVRPGILHLKILPVNLTSTYIISSSQWPPPCTDLMCFFMLHFWVNTLRQTGH